MEMLMYHGKFKLLFEQLAKPGYILDPHYADKLLVKLQTTNDPDIAKLLGSPFFSDLLVESLLHVETASVPVRAFFLRLIAAVATNELQFAKLVRFPGFILLNKVADISQTDVPPSIRVAYIEMAISITRHNTGVMWLLESKAWKYIFNMCYQNQTVFVLRSAYKFTSSFIWRLTDFADEENLIKIIEYILKPIIESPYHQIETITEEEEPSYVTPLVPSLQMLMATLKDIPRICKPNILIKLLTNHFVIKYNLMVILHISRNEEILLLISKILFLIALATVLQNQTNSEPLQDNHSILDLVISYFNTVHMYILRRHITPLLDYSITCNMYWSHVCDIIGTAPIPCNSKQREFQFCPMIIIPLVPIICYVKKSLDQACNQTIDDYITKILNLSSEHMTRAAYAMRDLIFENDSKTIALASIKRLFLLRNHLNRAQANTIFQALFYVLRDFVPIDDSCNLVLTLPPEHMEAKLPILSQVIDAVLMLLKGHNINWHESFEIICLYNATTNILRMPGLPTKLVVQALSLITLTVKKFIPPNLALLLESKDGSSLHEIGELIYSKMHDLSWEVRDSAMELLCECTEIAFIKYIPFQKLILANHLISTAATITLNDSEFYVRASGLKCIAAATKIQVIWDDLLTHYPDLYVTITRMFKYNPEGVVRREACNVITEVFQNQRLNENFKNCICKYMMSAALDDLHWEVQLVALKFWRAYIWEQLTYQGMIDGKFPAVTFSRDKKKIVNLTDKEIQKNMAVVLENLAVHGCLKALLGTLQEDTDVEVMEASLTISQDFLKILQKYNVATIIQPEEENVSYVKEEGMETGTSATPIDNSLQSDNVIDGIVEADDLNLLVNLCDTNLNIKNETFNDQSEIEHPTFVIKNQRVPPYTFLKAFEDKNFKVLIEEKRKWNDGIRSLHSVLDDVLQLYEEPDVNALDCY